MHVSDLLTTLSYWDLHRYKTLYVGFSGGIDSSALLHALSQIKSIHPKLKAIHVDHNIHTTSREWLNHCKQFCQRLNIPLIAKTIDKQSIGHANIEAQARQARYGIFKRLLNNNDALLLGHHQEDQAETILMRLLKGAGVKGLSAMSAESQQGSMTVLRPLLDVSKASIENYAKQHQLQWVEDPSNSSNEFDRNFLRNEIIPKLKQRYPNLDKRLSRSATLCQESHLFITQQIAPSFDQCLSEENTLSINELKTFTLYEQTEIIRQWLSTFEINAPSQATLNSFLQSLNHYQSDKHPLLELSNYCLQAHQNHLYCYEKNTKQPPNSSINWLPPFEPYTCIGINQQIHLISNREVNNIYIPKDAKLSILMRQTGEKILLNGQTKKVKTIIQSLNIPIWQRAYVPLIYINEQLATIADKIIADPFNHGSDNTHYLHVSMKKT